MAGIGRVVVGVDVGSSRIKAAGFTADGRRVRLSAVPTPSARGHDGIDFPVLDMLAAMRTVVAGLEVPPDDIAGIGFASMGETGTVLRDGALLPMDFPSWHDLRGTEVLADLHKRFDPQWLTGRTAGHVRTASSLTKLGWLHRAGVPLDGTFLSLTAAAAWLLTGQAVQVASLAVTAGAYDPVREEWDDDMWAAAGLARLAHPPVQQQVALPSTTTDWIALRPGTPVVNAGHDHPVGGVGLGAGPRDVIDSMGSGEALLTRWRPDRVPSIDEVATMVGTGFSLEAWPGSGDLAVIKEGLLPGFAMHRLAELIDLDRDALEALTGDETHGRPLPAGLVARLERATHDDEATATSTADAGGTVAAGVAAPVSATVAAEIAERGSGPAVWSALIRHYALAGADGEAQLRALTGADGRLVLTGGGLRSRRWVTAKLAARDHATPVVEAPEQEAVARGAAALAGVAAGWWADAAAMPGGGV